MTELHAEAKQLGITVNRAGPTNWPTDLVVLDKYYEYHYATNRDHQQYHATATYEAKNGDTLIVHTGLL